jgi:hypothetical protein
MTTDTNPIASTKLDHHVTAYFRRIGSKGGAATRAKLTPERRAEIARNAALARHRKTTKPSTN